MKEVYRALPLGEQLGAWRMGHARGALGAPYLDVANSDQSTSPLLCWTIVLQSNRTAETNTQPLRLSSRVNGYYAASAHHRLSQMSRRPRRQHALLDPWSVMDHGPWTSVTTCCFFSAWNSCGQWFQDVHTCICPRSMLQCLSARYRYSVGPAGRWGFLSPVFLRV